MPGKFRIGVVGVGYMGRLHVRNYMRQAEVDLVAVADIDPTLGRQAAKEFKCDYVEDSKDMIGLVDAVSIAVPSVGHFAVAKPFIEAGVHILMEKPLASTVDEAQRLVELADEHGIRLLVGHQERFNSAVMAVADRMGEPKFINAQRCGQFAGRNGDVDVITDLMIHDIDLILALVKSPVKNVSAVGASVVTEHVDIANARIEFESGAAANVTASRVSNDRIRTFEVYDGDQYLTLDLLNQSITSTSAQQENQLDGDALVAESITIAKKHTLESEIEHFVQVLSGNAEPLVTAQDGLSALLVANMVYREIEQEA